MEKAFYALRAKARGADDDAHRGLALDREYGLRPDLLAAINVWTTTRGRASPRRKARRKPSPISAISPRRERERLARLVDEMARGGMRVLAVARAGVAA